MSLSFFFLSSSRKKKKKKKRLEVCREELFTPGSLFLMYCSFPARLLGRNFGGFSALAKGDSGGYMGVDGGQKRAENVVNLRGGLFGGFEFAFFLPFAVFCVLTNL